MKEKRTNKTHRTADFEGEHYDKFLREKNGIVETDVIFRWSGKRNWKET
jgi:hypothetical protein